MTILEYIVLSIALGISSLVVIRDSAEKKRIRLSRGLLVALVVAIVQTVMLELGILIGNLLRFDMPDYDNLIFLGVFLLVAIRMLAKVFRRNKETPAFDISHWGTIFALAVAVGINVLLIGIGAGFRVLFETDLWRSSIPMLVVLFVFCYWAIMLGRQKVDIRPKRWCALSVLMLLVLAVSGAFFS